MAQGSNFLETSYPEAPMNLKTIVKSTLVLAILFEAIAVNSPANARCERTGREVRGLPEVYCTPGGRTRCVKTGKFIIVKGRKVLILRCPNRR
jgi:hypothetical protein